jgi:hypothetical protein
MIWCGEGGTVTRTAIGKVLEPVDRAAKPAIPLFDFPDEEEDSFIPPEAELAPREAGFVLAVTSLHLDLGSNPCGERFATLRFLSWSDADAVVLTDRAWREGSRELVKSRKEVTPSDELLDVLFAVGGDGKVMGVSLNGLLEAPSTNSGWGFRFFALPFALDFPFAVGGVPANMTFETSPDEFFEDCLAVEYDPGIVIDSSAILVGIWVDRESKLTWNGLVSLTLRKTPSLISTKSSSSSFMGGSGSGLITLIGVGIALLEGGGGGSLRLIPSGCKSNSLGGESRGTSDSGPWGVFCCWRRIEGWRGWNCISCGVMTVRGLRPLITSRNDEGSVMLGLSSVDKLLLSFSESGRNGMTSAPAAGEPGWMVGGSSSCGDSWSELGSPWCNKNPRVLSR